MSPLSLSLIECKNKTELNILQKLYRYPLLLDKKWNFNAKREFDMTNDSGLFHTGNVGCVLYEGKMMNMFTHQFAQPRYWVDEEEASDALMEKELNRIKKVIKSKSPSITPQIDSQDYRLVWRSITNSTNERTLISTILPPNVFLGNSLNYLEPMFFDGKKYSKQIPYDETVFLSGIFNSFVVDFILRHRVATNLNVFYMMELPIPRFDKTNKLHYKVFENSAKLICTTDEFSRLGKEIGVSEFVTDSSKRIALEAQINAYAAKIFGFTKKDLEYVLSTFPIVDKKLKELTLDEFSLIES